MSAILQLPRGNYSVACDISQLVWSLVSNVVIPDLTQMATVVEEISEKSRLNNIDFYKLPQNWQAFLVALVIRKDFIGREALTCFDVEFQKSITTEIEMRINALIFSVGDSPHIYRSGNPDETGFIMIPHFERIIYSTRIVENIYCKETGSIIETRITPLQEGFIQGLIATTPM